MSKTVLQIVTEPSKIGFNLSYDKSAMDAIVCA